ncbi:hypothetical protein D3C80_2087850 [compost metagenome]
MVALHLHHAGDLAADKLDLFGIALQIAITAVIQRRERVDHAVDRQLAPVRRGDIIVPGDVRQCLMQHFRQVAQ